MSRNIVFFRKLNIFATLLAVMVILTGCYDDIEIDDPDYIGEGTALVTGTFDFMPLSSTSLETRSPEKPSTIAPPGNGLGEVSDMCVLIYDGSQKLLEIRNYNPSDLDIIKVKRGNADAANGKLAEEETYHGEFSLKLPYGRYHIYAVANLGQSKNGVVTSTRQELDKHIEQIQTVDGLRRIKTTFDPDNYHNNCEMLGYFTNGQAEVSPSNADSPGVIVNRPSVQLHSWLRRCVSKVTVDFDPSGLNENIHIYLRRVTVRDVPADCLLGFYNMPDSIHELLRTESPIDPRATMHHIDFGDFKDGCDSQSEDYTKWPSIMKASGRFPANAHDEDAKALILYENMQGEGKDKRQFADKDGLVADRDIIKDNKPFGSYIEVEAYYQNLNAGSLSQGKIIYRFMLGQNVTDNFDVMRNCHYKITLAFRGNANDVDWHIEYSTPDPVVVPTPYYISYLYNHSMVLPLRMTPVNPNDRITKLTAKIIVNRWWPESATKNKVYFSDGICDSDIEANQGNGFLSLKPLTGINVVRNDGKYTNYTYNDPYYRGKIDGIDRSTRDDYPVSGTKAFAYYSSSTKLTGRDTVSAVASATDNSVEWGIPMYTRAKQLVSTTGYTGNNPYTGHIRVAKVLFTAELNNNPNTTMQKEVTVRQVERIVNPKGVYRKWNSREPFHVVLKKMNEEDDDEFSDYISQGPWRAYIVRGDRDFIDIGRPGNKTAKGSSGSAIDFNIRFKGSGGPDKVKSCVIRVEYNNYSCYHLIFVRQGYAPVPILADGKGWYVTNMLDSKTPADHPCDEGSMFKFGNWSQPIDVGASIRLTETWPNLNQNSFKARTDRLKLYTGSGEAKSEFWSNITYSKVSGEFDSRGGYSVATVEEINKLVKNCDIGFGVLYADGATETAGDIATAYGYNRAEGHTKGYGMRGAFAYNASLDAQYGGRNIFFPIGFTGFGKRKDAVNDPSGWSAVLRYAAGRWKPMDASEATNRPILWDLYRKPGANYWGRKQGSVGSSIGLDINYFSFDFNNIDAPNLLKDGGSDACFVRCIK